MGEIIRIFNDYDYQLPKMPSREKDILFYDLPPQEQYWRIPKRKNVFRLSEFEKIEYINQQRDWWENGLWFFNYDASLGYSVPTYITGMHFDHMVNMHFDFGMAGYYDQQRLDFYMRDLVRHDPYAYGTLWFKPRRYGMTAEEITQSIYEGMSDFNFNIGLMSNEGTKAVTTLMQPIINSMVFRPAYSRPIFYKPSGKKPRRSIEFTDGQIDFEEIDIEESVSTLGGMIVPYNTTTAAMDGTKKRYVVMDEVWKWRNADPEETYNVNKKCVEAFGIAGKLSLLSTMGDSDDYLRAIKAGVKMWHESNPTVRDGNGRTISGLYRAFISAVHSKILPAEFTDRNGRVDVGRAEEFIYNDRKKLAVGSKAYIFEIRRMPLKIEEALSSAETGSTYDNARLQKRLDELSMLMPEDRPYVRGDFMENSNGRVIWLPNAQGLWKKAHDPYWEQYGIDRRNSFREIGGKVRPPINPEFVIGYDPVRYADPSSRNVSKAAAVVRQKFDYYGNGMANRYAAIMVYRPARSEDAHYQVYLAAKYFGAVVNHERQVETVEKEFKDRGAEALLMTNPKDNRKGLWTDSQRKVIKDGVDFITGDMAMEEGSDYDPILDIPFEELVEERMTFDASYTTPFDLSMADIMCHHGCSWLKITTKVDTDEKAKKVKELMYAKRQ